MPFLLEDVIYQLCRHFCTFLPLQAKYNFPDLPAAVAGHKRMCALCLCATLRLLFLPECSTAFPFPDPSKTHFLLASFRNIYFTTPMFEEQCSA